MARFYGEVRGRSRTVASREGSEDSGLRAHLRGWDCGVKIECSVLTDGRDVIRVYRTGGSNDPDREIFVAAWVDGDDTLIKEE